ncbi:MAG: alpha-amylase family glycosyl hydrolase [Candidatus Muiribacteriota bacterium]
MIRKTKIFLLFLLVFSFTFFAYEYDQGVTVEGNDVYFRFWAPGKQTVSVVGDFNDWDKEANLLELDGNGYWKTHIQLSNGQYRYQYLINGEKYIGDPYAREVDWDFHGPNAVLRVGEPEFEWTNDDFHMANQNDLIIYEMHIGDFSPEGTFNGARERIPYLAELGINAVKIMPIKEFPGDISWGYNPAYYFAPENAYGTPNELKALINELHNNGIGVILDNVFNHCSHDHPFNHLYNYHSNPYFNNVGNEWGMPNFDVWADATKRHARDVVHYWVREFRIDGFRYDYTSGIGYDGTDGMSFISWEARMAGNAMGKYIYQIAENLPMNPHMTHTTEIDAQWNDIFHHQLKANLREGKYKDDFYFGNLKRTMQGIDYEQLGYNDHTQVINFTENHDEERVIYEAMTNPHIDYHKAVRKAKLGAVALFTSAGVPMIYHGQEFGMDSARTLDPNKIDWDKLNESYPGSELYSHFRALINLRKNHMALRQNNIEEVYRYNNENVLIYKRWDNHGDIIIVALNFSDQDQWVDIPVPHDGTWHEYLFDYKANASSGKIADEQIPRSGAKIFSLKKTW